MKQPISPRKFHPESLKRECLGDTHCETELIHLLQIQIEEFLQASKLYSKASDRFTMAREIGKLRNGLHLIRAESLLDYIDLIEAECLHPDHFEIIDRLIKNFEEEYILLKNELQSYATH